MYKIDNLIIKQLNRWKGIILNIQALITATVSFFLHNPEELVITFSFGRTSPLSDGITLIVYSQNSTVIFNFTELNQVFYPISYTTLAARTDVDCRQVYFSKNNTRLELLT